MENDLLTLLSQYACCYMGGIVGNNTPHTVQKLKAIGPTGQAGDTLKDRQTHP